MAPPHQDIGAILVGRAACPSPLHPLCRPATPASSDDGSGSDAELSTRFELPAEALDGGEELVRMLARCESDVFDALPALTWAAEADEGSVAALATPGRSAAATSASEGRSAQPGRGAAHGGASAEAQSATPAAKPLFKPPFSHRNGGPCDHCCVKGARARTCWRERGLGCGCGGMSGGGGAPLPRRQRACADLLRACPPPSPIPASSPRAESPQWRRGPAHKPVLCNACGTRYRRTNQLGPVAARPGAAARKRPPPAAVERPAKEARADDAAPAVEAGSD